MKKHLVKICLALAVILLAPGVAQAQGGPWQVATEAVQLTTGGPAVATFLSQSHRRKSDPAFVHQVLQNARRLQARGLPTAPYLLKANEGLAKGIPPARMQGGLRRTEQQTELAGRLVDQSIARGMKVENAAARRKLAQQYQWALVNEVPPRKIREMNPRDSKQMEQELRKLTKASAKGKPKPAGEKQEKGVRKKEKGREPGAQERKEKGKAQQKSKEKQKGPEKSQERPAKKMEKRDAPKKPQGSSPENVQNKKSQKVNGGQKGQMDSPKRSKNGGGANTKGGKGKNK